MSGEQNDWDSREGVVTLYRFVDEDGDEWLAVRNWGPTSITLYGFGDGTIDVPADTMVRIPDE